MKSVILCVCFQMDILEISILGKESMTERIFHIFLRAGAPPAGRPKVFVSRRPPPLSPQIQNRTGRTIRRAHGAAKSFGYSTVRSKRNASFSSSRRMAFVSCGPQLFEPTPLIL